VLRFKLPKQCPFCHAIGSVALEHTIKGGSVLLKWCCSQCSSDWSVKMDDQSEERRRGPQDRRRRTRKERRDLS
jgi:hypothetical protein